MEAAFPEKDPPPGRVRFETLRAELARNLLAAGDRPPGAEDAGDFGLDLNTTAVD